MIAVRAADELRLVVIATRAYQGHGRPKTPHDLPSVNQLPALPPTKPTEPFDSKPIC
jgi:hypothetical protein